MPRPFKCPYCGQSRTVSKGVRKTKSMGDRRIRLCKACGRKFTPRNQKPIEVGQDEVQSAAAQSEETSESRNDFYEGSDPAELLGEIFPPPDVG